MNKAIVAQIEYAGLSFEGLLLPDDSYAISVTQANKILQFSAHPNHASRSVKRILGDEFQPTRMASE